MPCIIINKKPHTVVHKETQTHLDDYKDVAKKIAFEADSERSIYSAIKQATFIYGTNFDSKLLAYKDKAAYEAAVRHHLIQRSTALFHSMARINIRELDYGIHDPDDFDPIVRKATQSVFDQPSFNTAIEYAKFLYGKNFDPAQWGYTNITAFESDVRELLVESSKKFFSQKITTPIVEKPHQTSSLADNLKLFKVSYSRSENETLASERVWKQRHDERNFLLVLASPVIYAGLLVVGTLLTLSGIGAYRAIREEMIHKLDDEDENRRLTDDLPVFFMPVIVLFFVISRALRDIIKMPFAFFTKDRQGAFLDNFIFGQTVRCPGDIKGSYYQHKVQATAHLFRASMLLLGILTVGTLLSASGVGSSVGLDLILLAGKSILSGIPALGAALVVSFPIIGTGIFSSIYASLMGAEPRLPPTQKVRIHKAFGPAGINNNTGAETDPLLTHSYRHSYSTRSSTSPVDELGQEKNDVKPFHFHQ